MRHIHTSHYNTHKKKKLKNKWEKIISNDDVVDWVVNQLAASKYGSKWKGPPLYVS